MPKTTLLTCLIASTAGMSTPPLWAGSTRTVDSTHTSPRKQKAKKDKPQKQENIFQSYGTVITIILIDALVFIVWVMMKQSSEGRVYHTIQDVKKTDLATKLPTILETTCKQSGNIEEKFITTIKKAITPKLQHIDTFLAPTAKTYVHDVKSKSTGKMVTVMVKWKQANNPADTYTVGCYAVYAKCDKATQTDVAENNTNTLNKAAKQAFPANTTT